MRALVPSLLIAAALAGCIQTAEPTDPGASGDLEAGPATTVGSDDAPDGTPGDTGGDASTGSAPMGSVSLFLKDAPEDTFKEVWVNVSSASVHLAGNDTNGCTGWTVVQDQALSIELLNTSGAVAAFLGESELPAACKVIQIRLNATGAYGTTHEGKNETISLANGSLKINRPFNVTADQETRVVVDIDLNKSLKKTGGPNGGWKLTPVIGKTTVEVVDDASSGEEAGEPGDVQATPEAGQE